MLDWWAAFGRKQKETMEIGEVNRTLILVDKLNEAGSSVFLTRHNPRIVCADGAVIPLKRHRGMFLMEMWYRIPRNSKVNVLDSLNQPFTRQAK